MNKRKRWKFNSFLVSVQFLKVGQVGRALGAPMLFSQNLVISRGKTFCFLEWILNIFGYTLYFTLKDVENDTFVSLTGCKGHFDIFILKVLYIHNMMQFRN